MTTEKFTWVKTHKELVEIISKKRSQQVKLIEALRKVGIAGLHDEKFILREGFIISTITLKLKRNVSAVKLKKRQRCYLHTFE